MITTIGILREMQPYEKRVALIPDSVARLTATGFRVLVEKEAGASSYNSEEDYVNAKAEIALDRSSLLSSSDIVVSVQSPAADEIRLMKQGSTFIGLIFPLKNEPVVKSFAKAGVTAFSLELMPRITRAQSMDVLSSQYSIAGYRGALLGAIHSSKVMPMLTTAAGTVRPAKVLVIGAGVSGLMAIATSKRMGADVSAYDVRREAGADVRSLGVPFIEPKFDAAGTGGYARDLTEDEVEEQQKLLENAILSSDVIITTASVPGKKAPLIISAELVQKMAPGRVIVDLAAESGGNCALTRMGETVEVRGVKIVGPPNLPSESQTSSSQMFSRNILSFLTLVTKNSKVEFDENDEIVRGCMVTHSGNITFKPLEKKVEK